MLKRPFLLTISALLVAFVSLSIFASDEVEIAASDDSAQTGSTFPDSWFYYEDKRPQTLRDIEGTKAPALTAAAWEGEPVDIGKLKGKVVVVDFWATWCPPCRASIPKNIKLVDEYTDNGVVFVGVHDANRGWDKAPLMIKEKNINYAVALDKPAELQTENNKRQPGISSAAWKVKFWPTYFVLDRKGIIRAAGLKPEHVEDAVKVILAEPAEIPASWLEGNADKRKSFDSLEKLNAPPPLTVSNWMNSDPMELKNLKGKVVLLDFWATWCGPCLRAIPHTNELWQQYKDEGLMIIGVCNSRGAEKMAATSQKHKMQYPICADTTGKTAKSYVVNSYPDYYFIDRAGKLRIIDCKNNKIDDAIRLLLAEPEPE